MEVKKYKDKQEVAQQFSEHLSSLISKNGKVNVALSGGSTPKAIFDYMAENKERFDWHKINLFWGDERCVPPEDSESNYKMTVDHLISKIDMPETNVHRVQGENTPSAEATRYSQLLSEKLPVVNGIPQFDMVILGMGTDGHTASIFPHQIDLWHSEQLCEVAQHPESGQNRITLTGKVINHAKEIVFLVTGDGKQEKVAEIIHKTETAQEYPANLVAPQNGQLYWYLDEKAAWNL